ncbi:hypothetical protein MSG28_003201 [Choristoneura fumiferana]|uniref:Uncharacterized protein n=1 Tax=Choristoneura fumiferana TaxID=7141 RepID=A0ACC0KE09_CHOFU|nr:hypothetical protein MSG28_003201 [Choristoneura fumiferana]
MDDGNLGGLREELEKWAEASQLLVTASDNLRQCFGTQKLLKTNSISSALMGLSCYVFLQIFVLNAGQRAQNEAKHLYRNLCALNNMLVGCAEAAACARCAAALVRRLRAAPLRVRLLSSLTVQMALLADILALVANYTIVLLQFNHIV